MIGFIFFLLLTILMGFILNWIHFHYFHTCAACTQRRRCDAIIQSTETNQQKTNPTNADELEEFLTH